MYKPGLTPYMHMGSREKCKIQNMLSHNFIFFVYWD